MTLHLLGIDVSSRQWSDSVGWHQNMFQSSQQILAQRTRTNLQATETESGYSRPITL